MSDVAIRASATGSAPRDYTIPGAQELLPKSVSASIDGSGAATTFYPCLQILDPGGHVMVSAITGTSFAAGASVDVSWFPHLADVSVGNLPNPGQGCVQYVGQPTGVAATDTAAIQAAHDALPSGGGIVQLCRGTYELTGNPALSFTKPIWLQGHGRSQTVLNYSSATGFAIQASSTDGAVFDHFGMINTSGAASSGGGIHISGGGNRTEFNRINVTGFYDCIFKEYGNGATWDKCGIFNYVRAGIRIQNVTQTDAGDDSVTNCQISAGGASGTTAGIFWESGGNLRLVGNQLFGGNETGSSCGILLSVLDGVDTSDFLLTGNTIEEFAYCIAANQQGAFTGKLHSFTLWGNEVFKSSLLNGNCLNFVANAAGDFTAISVGGNVITGGVYGLGFGNVNTIIYGPNTYGGAGVGNFHDYGGTVGGLQVGPG